MARAVSVATESATLPAAPEPAALEPDGLEESLTTTEPPSPKPSGGPGFNAREILRLAWPLFQESLLRCLPLAILAAAASAVPQAETAANRAAGLPPHTREWWGVLLATTALSLICIDSVLRLQLAAAQRSPAAVMDSMRRSVASLPGTFAMLLLALAPLLPALLWISMRGANWLVVLWMLAGLGGLLLVFFAWPMRTAEGAAPWDALRRAMRLVRAHFTQVAMLAGVMLAAVLVFAQLTGIFIGLIMKIAGPEAQTSHAWLSVSRWLMAGVIAVPLIYMGAVSVAAYRQTTGRR
jgi:hypothetical protein